MNSRSDLTLSIIVPPIIAILLLVGNLCSPAHGQDEAELASYIEYIPTKSDFKKNYHQAVTLIAKGVSENDKSSLKAAIGQLSSKLKTASRGKHKDILFLRGYAQEKLGDYKSALSSYSEALRVSQRDEKIRFRQAMCLRKLKQCDKAIKQLKELLWMSKSHEHEILFLLGECYSQESNDLKALEYYEKSRQKNPYFAPNLKRIIAEKEKLMAASDKIMEKSQLERDILSTVGPLIEVEPNNTDAVVKYGNLLLKHTDSFLHKQQLRDLRDKIGTIVADDNYENDKAVKLLFDLYVNEGNIEKAEEVLTKGLEKKGKSSVLKAASKQLAIEKTLAAKEREEDESSSN